MNFNYYDMEIKSLHVRNTGLFDSLDVKFNNKFNFIVGPNASGKTSIIKNMALALNPGSANEFRFRDGSEIWIDFLYEEKLYRVGIGDKWVDKYIDYRSASHRSWSSPPKEEGIISLTANNLEEKKIFFSPLFIGAFRKISYKRVNGMTRDEIPEKKRTEYREKSTKLINGNELPDVKQWLINRYFQIEKEWAVYEKQNWEWLLSHFKIIGPHGSDFNFVNIKRDLEPIFTIKGKECYLEELSAGYQAILSIIFCIFDWVESTNEEDKMLIQQATGTIIIDELDAHMHPEWQLTIRDSLDVLFPNLQFIISTHSPHIVSSAKIGELLILPEHTGTLNLEPSTRTFSGWNTDQILEEIMGVKSLENKEYNSLINSALVDVENKNIESLQENIHKLKEVSHSSDTIVSALEIKLAGLKLNKQ